MHKLHEGAKRPGKSFFFVYDSGPEIIFYSLHPKMRAFEICFVGAGAVQKIGQTSGNLVTDFKPEGIYIPKGLGDDFLVSKGLGKALRFKEHLKT